MFHKKWALLFIMTSLLTFATYIADAQDGPLGHRHRRAGELLAFR